MKNNFLPLFFSIFISTGILTAQDTANTDLKFFEDLAKSSEWFFDSYEIALTFDQFIDHKNPDKGTFKQRVFIRHSDFNKPLVLHDRGYFARPYAGKTELTEILDCNEVEIEHRYFASSIPDNPDWQYLTIEQAAADQHRIVEWLKKFYKGKFIAVGFSKGGQTALFHEYFYPEDNFIVIPYVAPINLEMEDSRIWPYIYDSISTAGDRQKIIEYQRALLKRRDEIKPLVIKEIEDAGDKLLGDYDLCFEHAVLEFNFSWWQYGSGDISEIPDADAPVEQFYKPFKGTIDFFRYNAQKYDPFNYQAYTQIGFYYYDTRPFKDLLIAAKEDYSSNKPLFFDQFWDAAFDPEPLKKVHDFLVNEAERVIYIYGENDPWTAPGVWPSGKTSSFRMTLKDGNHGADILSFEGKELEKILTKLEEWLGIEISRSRVTKLKN